MLRTMAPGDLNDKSFFTNFDTFHINGWGSYIGQGHDDKQGQDIWVLVLKSYELIYHKCQSTIMIRPSIYKKFDSEITL